MSSLKMKINGLKPGYVIQISQTKDAYCTAERSGDGKTLRFVRHSDHSQKVFKTVCF